MGIGINKHNDAITVSKYDSIKNIRFYYNDTYYAIVLAFTLTTDITGHIVFFNQSESPSGYKIEFVYNGNSIWYIR